MGRMLFPITYSLGNNLECYDTLIILDSYGWKGAAYIFYFIQLSITLNIYKNVKCVGLNFSPYDT